MTDAPIFYYTRCPAPTATGVAAGLGLLPQLIAAGGYRAKALQDEPGEGFGRHHFDHGIPNLVREGGNVPPIWTRSRGQRTRLVGITWLDEVQAIVVRPDDPAQDAGDLAGRRVAIARTAGSRLDVFRSSRLRGFEVALSLSGRTLDDVELVDVDITPAGPGRPGENFDDELAALADGRVDAIWVKAGTGAAAIRTGAVRAILRIDRLEDPLLRVNAGTPRLLTFRQDFIDANPGFVGRYIASVNAAVRSVGEDSRRLWEILAGETGNPPEDAAFAYQGWRPEDLVLTLDPARIAAVQVEADFLHRHGFIPEPVDVAAWALHTG